MHKGMSNVLVHCFVYTGQGLTNGELPKAAIL